MNPAISLLLGELVRIAMDRVMAAGKFNTLTEAEARLMAAEIGASLKTRLPSPEELQNPQT